LTYNELRAGVPFIVFGNGGEALQITAFDCRDLIVRATSSLFCAVNESNLQLEKPRSTLRSWPAESQK
jgi:hypothetical protein